MSAFSSKPRVLVLGSSNTDMVIKVDHLPKPGETILGGKFTTVSGGKGANQAVSAARAGGGVTFIARVGTDMFGDKAVAAFVADGINVDHVFRDANAPSGVALILVGKNGENSIAVASGANGNLSPQDLRKCKELFLTASVVVTQLETPLPTVQVAARFAAKAGVRFVLNPAPARSLPAALLKDVFLLTPNETEAELLTGLPVRTEKDAARAAGKLLKKGVKNVIITLGSRGAYIAQNENRTFIPAYKVKAVDTTGAGDVFNGTLAVALAEGKSLVEAAHFANAAAAISVTRLGTQTSVPGRKEIEDLLDKGKLRPALIGQKSPRS